MILSLPWAPTMLQSENWLLCNFIYASHDLWRQHVTRFLWNQSESSTWRYGSARINCDPTTTWWFFTCFYLWCFQIFEDVMMSISLKVHFQFLIFEWHGHFKILEGHEAMCLLHSFLFCQILHRKLYFGDVTGQFWSVERAILLNIFRARCS